MKFTTDEAEGIRPFVANSPLMGWLDEFMSVRDFPAMLGVASSGGDESINGAMLTAI